MLLELLIVLVLVLCNGLLSMSELAVVSSRPARLKVMAAEGNKGAAVALKLAEDPGKFLSSAQVGISLIGVLSGAFRARRSASASLHTCCRAGCRMRRLRPSAWAPSWCSLPMSR